MRCFRSRSPDPWYQESIVEQGPEPQDSNSSLNWGLYSWPLSCNSHCRTCVRNCCHAVPMPALEDTLETSPQDLTLCPIPLFSSELEGTLCGITQQSDLSTCSWSRWEGQPLGRFSHPVALSTCLHVLGSFSCSGCMCSARSWWPLQMSPEKKRCVLLARQRQFWPNACGITDKWWKISLKTRGILLQGGEEGFWKQLVSLCSYRTTLACPFPNPDLPCGLGVYFQLRILLSALQV